MCYFGFEFACMRMCFFVTFNEMMLVASLVPNLVVIFLGYMRISVSHTEKMKISSS